MVIEDITGHEEEDMKKTKNGMIKRNERYDEGYEKRKERRYGANEMMKNEMKV